MKKFLLLILVSLIIAESKAISDVRNLDEYRNYEQTYDIKTIYILGQEVDFKEKVIIKGGKISSQLIITTSSGSAIFERNELTLNHKNSLFVMIPFMKIAIPEAPDTILTLKGVSNINYYLHKAYSTGEELRTFLDIKGEIYVNADYAFGGDYKSIEASAKGTLINLNIQTEFKEFRDEIYEIEERYDRSKGGIITVHLIGKTIDDEPFSYDHKIFDGWDKWNS